ncbi:DUF6445 family protein [Sphingomonas jaspsi]|uniref:DUF6445 family protein n=1 Tax=Sphingomonas jaspsi TaxID=392409 RepID=UPI0004B42BFC|nr:DUF6445 family protein [Sphingomonas jaspsi]
MIPCVFVIDDFHPNPYRLRQRALSFNYGVEGRYPGQNSHQKVEINWLEQAIGRIVGAPVHAPWGSDYSHQCCRLALASDGAPARIHIDESDWTGVLYLTLDEDCQGGTEFYRHRPTMTDRVPMTVEGVQALGFPDYETLQHQILDIDALDRSKWELSMRVPMRFNRLVLLQAQYWHTAGPSFGDCPENGRLVYLMFFKHGPGVSRTGS